MNNVIKALLFFVVITSGPNYVNALPFCVRAFGAAEVLAGLTSAGAGVKFCSVSPCLGCGLIGVGAYLALDGLEYGTSGRRCCGRTKSLRAMQRERRQRFRARALNMQNPPHIDFMPAGSPASQADATEIQLPQELPPIYHGEGDDAFGAWCDDFPSTIIVSNPDDNADDSVVIAITE